MDVKGLLFPQYFDKAVKAHRLAFGKEEEAITSEETKAFPSHERTGMFDCLGGVLPI